MSQPEPHHFLALAALASAADDPQALLAASKMHSDALRELLSGSLGPDWSKTVGKMLEGLPQTSAGGTSHSSTAAALGPSLVPTPGPSSMAPPQVSPLLPLQTPISEPAPAPRTGSSAMQDAPRMSRTPSYDRSNSVTSTDPSNTRPSPAASPPRDDADDEATSEGDTGLPTAAKRKRDEGDAAASSRASASSGTGRKLRGRRGKTDQEAEPSAGRASRSRAPPAKGGKGKKKAVVVDEKGGEESDDESVIIVTKKSRTSRSSAPRPSSPPKPSVVHDPLPERRREMRPAPVQSSQLCLLAKEQDASHVDDSVPAPPGPAAAPDPSARALLAQDPLGLAGLSACMSQFCAYMVRFNEQALVMEALLGGILEFNARVAQLLEGAALVQSSQTAGGGSLPPPSSSPSSPSRDVSPASHESRKRRRVEIDVDASSTVPGAPTPSATLGGVAGAARGPAAAVGAVPVGSSEVASTAGAPAPSGPDGDPSTPPHATAEPTSEAQGASGSGGGPTPMDVDKTPTH
ncbi:hypothetical protein EV715DRAFT_296983 [Schizophyllum commune]